MSNDKQICPLCSGPNHCRIGSTERCWCARRPVSKEALESTLGEFSLDKTCLCSSCLAKFENVDVETLKTRTDALGCEGDPPSGR